ncbi:LysR family transcriptional regulator [Mycolicibacterium sp.]|uniref:LysR family transcriptional regulator n=1 Tax=Mycolicibacterium sp. TaxID=2320850 RepID=UPI003D0DBB0B
MASLPELDDWTFFDGIARARSLTAAAREWGVSVPAVSKRLGALESRLGVQLVRRSTRALSLTDEGVRLAEGAARVLREIHDVEDSLLDPRAGLRGRLAVHSTIGLGRMHVAPILRGFAEQHPQLRLELELSALPLNIAGSPFDVGIRVGRVADSRLHGRLLIRQRRVLCASPGYLDRCGTPRDLADLGRHNCIVLRQDESDYAIWRFGPTGAETAIRVDGTLLTNDGETATRWCLEGAGIIMRSQWHVEPLLRDGSLVQVLPEEATPEANIVAVYPTDVAPARRIGEFLDALKAGLAARLPFLVN